MDRSPLLLDTHIWIWFTEGSSEIPTKMRMAISQSIESNQLFIAAISLWELGMLEARGRLSLQMNAREWIKHSLEFLRLQILPLTPEIAIDSSNLPGSLHGDPADRLIIASARNHGCTLVTKDMNILRYANQHHVKVLT